MSTAEDEFSEKDLAPLQRGKSRARTATERRAEGGAPAPPPPIPTPPVTGNAPPTVTEDRQSPEPTAPPATSVPAADPEERPGEPAGVATIEGKPETKSPGPSARSSRSASARTAAETGETGTQGTFSANVPTSVVRLVDSDRRSRANVLRAALEDHGQTVVKANPVQPPSKLGLEPARENRSSVDDDPFQPVLFRFRPHEKTILDEWTAKTSLSRSAFVTELLTLELKA